MTGPRDGGRPAGYSSKLDLSLEPGMPAGAAVRAVLRRLLQTVEDNLECTRRAADEECLHDFRVAVRRARSCLGQLKRVLPREEFKPLRRELAWLGGPLRDLDVLLLAMPRYVAGLPPRAHGDVAGLIALLEQRQRAERRRLTEQLDSERFRELLDLWRRAALRDDRPPGASRDPVEPIGAVAAARIAAAFARVLDHGRSIDSDSEEKRLHRLRIECKKLRYLLEFFRSLFDAADVEPLVRSLKRLQDCLGTFNDLRVQLAILRDASTRMAESGCPVDATAAAAIGRLIERLERQKDRERARFARRFSAFDLPGTRARLGRIAGAGRGGSP